MATFLSILKTFGGAASKVLLSMLMALATEVFLKDVIVMLLEKVVAKTESKVDDRILEKAKKAWGVEE